MTEPNINNSIWFVIDNNNQILKKFRSKQAAYEFYYMNLSDFKNVGKMLYVVSDADFNNSNNNNFTQIPNDFGNSNQNAFNNQSIFYNPNLNNRNSFNVNAMEEFKDQIIYEVKKEVRKAISNEMLSIPQRQNTYYPPPTVITPMISPPNYMIPPGYLAPRRRRRTSSSRRPPVRRSAPRALPQNSALPQKTITRTIIKRAPNEDQMQQIASAPVQIAAAPAVPVQVVATPTPPPVTAGPTKDDMIKKFLETLEG